MVGSVPPCSGDSNVVPETEVEVDLIFSTEEYELLDMESSHSKENLIPLPSRKGREGEWEGQSGRYDLVRAWGEDEEAELHLR